MFPDMGYAALAKLFCRTKRDWTRGTSHAAGTEPELEDDPELRAHRKEPASNDAESREKTSSIVLAIGPACVRNHVAFRMLYRHTMSFMG